MAIKNLSSRKPSIDLSGPGGNAFALIGAVKTYGRQLGFDQDTIKSIQEKMMSGDYENLIAVFDENFGDYVDLER